MLKVKCTYYIKLFVITVLAVALLMSVEIAPQLPIAFLAEVLTLIISIRLLWVSALKDERKLNAAAPLALHRSEQRVRKKSRKAA